MSLKEHGKLKKWNKFFAPNGTPKIHSHLYKEETDLKLFKKLNYNLIYEKVKNFVKMEQKTSDEKILEEFVTKEIDSYINVCLRQGPKWCFRNGLLNTVGWTRGYTK